MSENSNSNPAKPDITPDITAKTRNRTTRSIPAESDLLDRNGARAFLTIAPRTLDEWTADGALKCIKWGRFIRYRRSDLLAFLEQHTTEPRAVTAFRPRRRKANPAAQA